MANKIRRGFTGNVPQTIIKDNMIFGFGLRNSLGAGGSIFINLGPAPFNVGGANTVDPTIDTNQELYYALVMPVAGTFKNFYVYLNSGLGHDTPGHIDLWINGADANLGSDLGNDPVDVPVLYSNLINSDHVNAGDLVCVWVQNSASSLRSITFTGSVEFIPD